MATTLSGVIHSGQFGPVLKARFLKGFASIGIIPFGFRKAGQPKDKMKLVGGKRSSI
jgi:hypothetical protein